MSIKKVLLGLVIVSIVGAGIAFNIWWRTPNAPEVQVETAALRDLTAIVSGSGAIRPAREVNISSNVMGRVTRLAVVEGQLVEAGDFLLEVDPQRLQSTVAQMQASLESSRAQVALAGDELGYARQVLDRREGLYRQDLLSRERYDDALQSVERAERTLQMRQQDVLRLKAGLEQSRYDLTQVIIDAPMDGIITKLNIEQGENVVTGTMNNAGTVLLTIADLSIVELEIEVDETDIVHVELRQEAAVRIDAFPSDVFDAVVTEVGKSPISIIGGNQAINFKVVVRLTDTVPGARPGLSGTADITIATRDQVLTVPIQALILREVRLDKNGEIIREEDPLAMDKLGLSVKKPEEGEAVELEGVFVVYNGRALFMPIQIGIAGERYFEALEGIEKGGEIIVGPFEVIRTLIDGEKITIRENEDLFSRTSSDN